MLKKIILISFYLNFLFFSCSEKEKPLPNNGAWKRIADFPVDVYGGHLFYYLFSIYDEAFFAVNPLNGIAQIWSYNESADTWLKKMI
jgi:hypothetical protein